MNEIVQIKEVQEYELMKRQAAAFHASGMFPDIKSHAQALVKVMVGKELGLSPFASITGIHMVQGKPVIGANLIATMLANHPRYNYRILKSTKEVCEIEFYDSKDKIVNKDTAVGAVLFTIQEAQEAGLLGKDNWKKYASDMLFARAISRGAKRYAPGIFGGAAVYTPDEMGVDTDEDGVIEMPKEIPVGTIDNPRRPQYAGEPGVTTLEMPGKPIPGSDEAIIEEIKQTHAINTEFR